MNIRKVYAEIKNIDDFVAVCEKGHVPVLKSLKHYCAIWRDICDYIQNNDKIFELVSEDNILTALVIDDNLQSFNVYSTLPCQDVQDYFNAMYLRKTGGIKPKISDLLRCDDRLYSLLRFCE
jgi:hypothetical protein